MNADIFSRRYRKRIVLTLGFSSLLFGGWAYADYVLQDGTRVRWLGGNTIEVRNPDGSSYTTSNTSRNAEGRLVANEMNDRQRSQTNQLGSQTSGGDSRFRPGANTVTIPVYENGRFVGYANNHQDSNGLGRTYYTGDTANGREGTAVIDGSNGGSADFNWTRVDLSSRSSSPPSRPPGSSNQPQQTSNPRSTSSTRTNPTPPPPTNLLRSSSIEHNAAWEAVRVKHGRAQSEFYAGEKFVVRATATQDATAMQVTFQFPQAAKDLSPAFREPTEPARPALAATFSLRKVNTYDWEGTFWKKSWMGLSDGTYSIIVTASFQNGQTRTTTHTVQIRNSILDFANGIEKVDQ